MNFFNCISDGAEGVAQNSPVFVLVGSNITVIGFFNISGNPTPNSTWSSNGSEVSDSRFNILVLGQLTISSILLSDAGNYTNTLMNNVVGKPISVNNTIEIFVAGKSNYRFDIFNKVCFYILFTQSVPQYLGMCLC